MMSLVITNVQDLLQVGQLETIFADQLSRVTSCHAIDITRTQNGTMLTPQEVIFIEKRKENEGFLKIYHFHFWHHFGTQFGPMEPSWGHLGAC